MRRAVVLVLFVMLVATLAAESPKYAGSLLVVDAVGVPAVPTASAGTNATQAASTASVATAPASDAPLALPASGGTPTTPTPAITNTDQTTTGGKRISALPADKVDVRPPATAFGDSITRGWVGPSFDPANGYATHLAAAKGWTLTNLATDGTTLEDAGEMDLIWSRSPTTADTYFILSGYNNMRNNGMNAIALATYKSALYAALAHLAIPASRKVLPSAATSGGTWTSSVHGGQSTSTNGATKTFSVNGSTVYVASESVNAQSGQFTVNVDGVSYGTFNCFGNPVTLVGREYTPFLVRIPHLRYGPHTVVVTKTAGDFVYFLWGAGNAGAGAGPRVYVGDCLRMNSAGYAIGPHGSDEAAAAYAKTARAVVYDLASDGLNVTAADTSGTYNPLTDVGSDNVHPSATGHQKIVDAFVAASQCDADSVRQRPDTARRRARRAVPLHDRDER